ncbi:MAG: serine/threonine protein phosphatase [Halothiobacillus sp. 35-54-62]|jgi:serine phosphatase RsbU (regulator of sigma subunit)|nr:SpoIIE family protein phosphatase [Halothiobacillaceae bacterium]OYY36735.1 MAG: serine/threonine protein phosphatase [Halothiobacillus sp. 35-54-62]OZA79425.1 MAG: serine/threonine protein phosphatase [Halothiobacillus sp. 39-53-45]HQS02691.1 SpoIIE family protein phosphatase [Halothiobacillus sp.]HQS28848.1 SpoIIE family protein phosphatase [Halothiobacillus sp.]
MLKEIRFAGDLLIEASAITPEFKNEDVLALFAQKSSLQNLPVLHDDGRPLGLINRNMFHSNMTKPYYPELYSQKSCIAFMDKSPLIVETRLEIEQLTALAVETGDKVFTDGFIIVREGKYQGIGQVLDLMHAMTELQARQHRQLIESIEYASVIQQSILAPSRIALNAYFPENHWLIWEPRDVVGGDIFHFIPTRHEGEEDGFLAVLFDCTGHGVPGAFMTLIAESALAQAIATHGDRDPAALLAAINQYIKHTLNQHDQAAGTRENSDDGLDGMIVRFDKIQQHLVFASARNPLFIMGLNNEEAIDVVPGDRKGAGYANTPMDATWHNHTLPITEAKRIFLITDGVIDQVGGAKKIALGKRRLSQILTESRNATASAQQAAFEEAFAHYQGQEKRRDDVTLLALDLMPGTE